MPAPERRPALLKAETRPHPVAPLSPDPLDEPAARPGPVPARRPATGLTAMLSARVPVELRYDVKVHAARNRMSVQEVLIEAIRDYLHK